MEEMVDRKLEKWHKDDPVRDIKSIQFRWKFHQSHIFIDVFREGVHFQYHSPRVNHRFEWNGLTNKTFRQVEHHVAHLAMVTMYPPIDPEDDRE